jgi:flavodoxin I
VTYYSESGNTEKLARAIYEGLDATGKKIAPISEVANLDDYDVLFVGFPVHGSSVPVKAEKCLKKIPEGKMLAIFATHGSLRGGQLAITAFHYAMSLAPKAQVIGSFGCRGQVKPNLLQALMNKPEHKSWAMEAQSAKGHPDDADLEDGKEFAKWMMGKALKLL